MTKTVRKATGKQPLAVSSLVQLFPLAIGVNILAYGAISSDIDLIPSLLGFILVFFIITTDSIVEYGAYNFNELPKSLYLLAVLNTLSITAYAVTLGILLNPHFKTTTNYVFVFSFVVLALQSLVEMSFCIVYKKLYSKIQSLALYQEQDYKIYAVVEVLSSIVYFFAAYLAYDKRITYDQFWVPFLLACLQLIEQLVWVKLKSKPNNIST